MWKKGGLNDCFPIIVVLAVSVCRIGRVKGLFPIIVVLVEGVCGKRSVKGLFSHYCCLSRKCMWEREG